MRAQSPTLEQLATALADAQAEFSAVAKTDENPYFNSKYAGLPSVVEAASPVLAKHGLAVSQLLGYEEDGGYDTLTTWLFHKSGEYIAESMRLHFPVGKDGVVKMDPQGQGSATTYARRYGYMAALGLVADDDDGNAGSGRTPAAQGDPEHPLGPEYNRELMGRAVGGACVKLCANDSQKGMALFKLIAKDCGGYMPQAAAFAVIRAADTENVVPDVQAPEPQ